MLPFVIQYQPLECTIKEALMGKRNLPPPPPPKKKEQPPATLQPF